MGRAAEKQLTIFTLWYLSVRYDENQLRAVPDMPYHSDKHLMSMLWSIVSKAADKSSKISAVTLPLSIFRVTLEIWHAYSPLHVDSNIHTIVPRLSPTICH